MKILIIEDEKELLESISVFLSGEQYTCEKAADFKTAIEKIHLHDYTCIILDINLPDGSGLEILKELNLTQEQANEIESVLDDFVMYYQMLQTQMEDVRSKGKDRIVEALNPEQRQKFERMLDEMQAKSLR